MVELDALVELSIDDRSWQAEVVSQGMTTSRHTGRELGLLDVTFGSGHGEDELVASLAARAREGRLRSGQEGSRRWRLQSSSYSYGGPRGPRENRWRLEEVELLRPDHVTIDGLDLRPNRYDERFAGERLEINLRTTLTQEQALHVQGLWIAGAPVTVTRSGISAETRSMELGWGPWSEAEGGSVKVELTLTDPGDSRLGRAFQPLIWNLRMAAGGARVRHDLLMSLLLTKGVITAEEADALNVEARAKAPRASMRLMLVEDLDSWPWDHDQNDTLG